MDWNDTPEQAAFRNEVRELIESGLPQHYREHKGEWVQDRKSDNPAQRDAATAWPTRAGSFPQCSAMPSACRSARRASTASAWASACAT